MNSECAFDHPSASHFVSKNRSTTMALSWLAVRPHRRAALRIPKLAGTQLLVQFRNSPGALTFGGTRRTFDDHSPRRTGPLYRPVGRLVNRISAAANACHDFVRMEPVAIRIFALISGAVPICIDQIRCQPCLRSITSSLQR